MRHNRTPLLLAILGQASESSRHRVGKRTNLLGDERGSASSRLIKARGTCCLLTLLTVIFYLNLLKVPPSYCLNAIAPTIDYSHNMRILKLPKSTPVGSLIYRLKGSDGDPNTQLVFGVSGIEGRALLEVLPVERSWNEADVYLRSNLEQQFYNLTIFVTDGNKTTQVESTIYVTEPELLDQQGLADTGATNLPFVNPKHVFHVPENSVPNEAIGSVTVLESMKSDLPVRFELRGKGSDKFSIKYVFGPSGRSKADIVLAQRVDYERQNLFSLKVLALNAWTNVRFDTRNVASLDIVITVGDVQDTAPKFKNLPHSLRLANTLQQGETLLKVEAEDGDYADQRPVNYALDAASPLSSYFSIDKFNGELKLIKPIGELVLHAAAWDSASWSVLTIFASEVPDTSSYDHLWPPMFARAELPLIMVDLVNEPPQFIGGWQTNELAGKGGPVLHGYMSELLLERPNLVQWYTNSSETGSSLVDNLSKSMRGQPSVLDLGLGSNGTFELSIEGEDAHLFDLEPQFPVTKQTTFTITVADSANKSQFDYDELETHRSFTFDLVARDFGTFQRMSSRIRCLVELLDVNDNSPAFQSDLYSFQIYENAQLGQLVGIIRARDIDSPATSGRVRYTSLTGQDSQLFKLDPENGRITVAGQLDREKKSAYTFLAEARDSGGTGRANYTQVMISILDVNDNPPVFLQSNYDAVLLADGTFHQPLVVKALDLDEPGSANSQVAYEIIAGNQNEQFSIDTVSGAIYPVPSLPDLPSTSAKTANTLPQIPPILGEPIVPFSSKREPHEQEGKLAPPNHEIEETPAEGLRRQPGLAADGSETGNRRPAGWPRMGTGELDERNSSSALNRSGAHGSGNSDPRSGRLSLPSMDVEQLPALDLLLNLESEQPVGSTSLAASGQPVTRSLPANPINQRLPPITTLIVRAHDFGIPLRSASVRVNIYNQALLSRTLSVIFNSSAESLEQKRQAIERAFGSVTGSRATIESIEALSESSSISVARMRLAVPQHSLVDLTDLSTLVNALDQHQQQVDSQSQQQLKTPNTIGHYTPMSSNITSSGGNIFSDMHAYALETNGLERRLLVYIIIVGVCILALLLIWLVYSCGRDDRTKLLEKGNSMRSANGNYRPTGMNPNGADSQLTSHKTFAKTTDASSGFSPIGNNLAKSQGPQQQQQRPQLSRDSQTVNELLLPPSRITTAKPDHYSMYNGQIWFEPSAGSQLSASQLMLAQRRASSAPSAASIDSALAGGTKPPRNGQGHFFPNTIGYMNNLASMEAAQFGPYNNRLMVGKLAKRHGRRRKVAPLMVNSERYLTTPHKPPRFSTRGVGHSNEGFVHDLESAVDQSAGQQRLRTNRPASVDSNSGSSSAVSSASVVLESDQELLGFDSTGTPIIATRARAVSVKPLVIDALDQVPTGLHLGAMSSPAGSRKLATSKGLGGTENSERFSASRSLKSNGTDGGSLANRGPTEAKAEASGGLKSELGSEIVEINREKRDSDASKSPPGTKTGGDQLLKPPENGDMVPEGGGKSDDEASRSKIGRDLSTVDDRLGASETKQAEGDLMSELSAKLTQRKQSSDRSDGTVLGSAEAADRVDKRAKLEDQKVKSASNSGDGGGSETETEASEHLGDMKNGELVAKHSIFALTYGGLATEEPPR